jgi:hypothetical protein
VQLVLRRLWIQITADRKRFGVLCAMLLIGLLLWARIIVTSDLPRTAVAKDPAHAPDGSREGGDGADGDRGPPVRVRLWRTPARDPLLISDKHFPKPTPVEGSDEDHPKSDGNATDDAQQAEKRRTEELWLLVGSFRLDGVMQRNPMAVINGKTYRLGSWIPAVDHEETLFQLVEIGDRSAVLECEGRKFRVSMDYPGIEER